MLPQTTVLNKKIIGAGLIIAITLSFIALANTAQAGITAEEATNISLQFNLKISNVNQQLADQVITWLNALDGVLSTAETWLGTFRTISSAVNFARSIGINPEAYLRQIGIPIRADVQVNISISEVDALINSISVARAKAQEGRQAANNLRNKSYDISVSGGTPEELQQKLELAMKIAVQEFVNDHNQLRCSLAPSVLPGCQQGSKGVFEALLDIVNQVNALRQKVGL